MPLSIGANTGIAQIIGIDEDDVWLNLGMQDASRQANQEQDTTITEADDRAEKALPRGETHED